MTNVDISKFNKKELIDFAEENGIEVDTSFKVSDIRDFITEEIGEYEPEPLVVEEEAPEEPEEPESRDEFSDNAGENGNVLLEFLGKNALFHTKGFRFAKRGGHWTGRPFRAVPVEVAREIVAENPKFFRVVPLDEVNEV